MEAIRRSQRFAGLADPHDRRVPLLAAVFARSLRHLSRDASAPVAQASPPRRRRTSLALPSPHPPDFGRGAAFGQSSRRFSKSAECVDRRFDRTQRRYREVASRGPRSVRMGEIGGGKLAIKGSEDRSPKTEYGRRSPD